MPGERRTLEIRLGSGGSVHGQLLDGAGRAIAGQEMWRMVGRWSNLRPVLFDSYEAPAATARTDELGRFRFDEVPVGVWCVGIAARSSRGRSSLNLPAYAEPVAITTEGEIVELNLRVDADLFLRGKVLDPAGHPVPRISVMGWLEGTDVHTNEQTDDTGSFKLGPLQGGTWSLSVFLSNSPHAAGDSVRAQAGSEDIVLQLRVGGSISGTVLSATGEQLDSCMLTLTALDAPTPFWSWGEQRGGSFKLQGLLPGRYLIAARDRSGAVGFSAPIALAEGQQLDGVLVRLTLGAKLRLRYEGEFETASYSVFVDGLPVNHNSISKHGSTEESVPPGAVEVRWKVYRPELVKSQRATVAVGDVQELVWDGKP
jgi:hypothetical protein